MKKRIFERELERRLAENKQLAERQFLPKRLGVVAARVSEKLFYLMLVISFGLTMMSFWASWSVGLHLSKKILMLE